MEGGCHCEDGGVFQAPGAFVQGCLVVVRKAYGVQSRLQLIVENPWRTSICACLAAHLKQQTVGRFKSRFKILLETLFCVFFIGELELAAARCESTEIIITLAWFLSDLADMTCSSCIHLSSKHGYFIHFCCLSPQYSFSKRMYILKCVTEYNLAGFTWSPKA